MVPAPAFSVHAAARLALAQGVNLGVGRHPALAGCCRMASPLGAGTEPRAGRHFPSDVLAGGMLVGTASAVLVWRSALQI